MGIRVGCDSCFHEFTVPDRAKGKRVRCPECKEPVRVIAEKSPHSQSVALPPRKSNKKKKSVPQSRKKSTKKSRKRPSSKPNPQLRFAGIGVTVLLVIGLIWFFLPSRGSDETGGDDRPVNREQKKFASGSNLSQEGKTTSEWFDLIIEMQTTENPNRQIMIRHAIMENNPRQFLGPDPAAVPVVLAGLKDRFLHDYSKAILEKFPQSGEPPYLVDLKEGMADSNPEVQFWSIQLLGRFGKKAAETVPTLTEFLNRKPAPEVDSSAKPAPQAGMSAHYHSQLPDAAALTLGKMGSAGLKPLHAALKRKSPEPSFALIQALGDLGSVAEPAVDDLVALLEKNESPKYRSQVLGSIEKIGPAAQGALPKLIAFFQKETEEAHSEQYINAFAKIGSPAVEPLREILPKTRPSVQVAILLVYERIGKPAIAAVPDVLGFLTGDNSKLHNTAQQTLKTLLPLASPPADQLRKMIEHGDVPLRSLAVRKLAENPADVEASAALLASVRSKTVQEANRWQSEIARLEVEKNASVKIFSSGRRNLDAEARRRESLAREQGEANATLEACKDLSRLIDNALKGR